jgi:hypothetical protein
MVFREIMLTPHLLAMIANLYRYHDRNINMRRPSYNKLALKALGETTNFAQYRRLQQREAGQHKHLHGGYSALK